MAGVSLTEAQKKIGDAVILERAARVLDRRRISDIDTGAVAALVGHLAKQLRSEAEREHAAGPDGEPGPDDHGGA
jgi:hypothetical protein